MPPTRADFVRSLETLLDEAARQGRQFVDVSAGELHQGVGGHPGNQHRMPICCRVMRDRMHVDDQILSTPPSGQGASLSIRYYLGRKRQDDVHPPGVKGTVDSSKARPHLSESSEASDAPVEHAETVGLRAVVLIPCSSSKQKGGATTWRAEVSAPNRLGAAGTELLKARARLAGLVGESAGLDLGSGPTCPPLLPALDRYRGLFDRGADFKTWPVTALERFRRQTLIVSGLYGLAAPDEAIRYYECAMDRTLPGHGAVSDWWRKAGLGGWLSAHLADVGATDLHLFLSASYLDALGYADFGHIRVHRTPYAASTDEIRQQGQFLRRLYLEGVCEHCRRGLR